MRCVHLYATYKVLHIQLGAHLELLTAHAEYLNHLFPVAFVIMTRKTQIAYDGVLQYLKRLVPQWEPEVVMVDFEAAIRNAARLVWPHIRVVGCFFHYAQAVYRMHTTLWLRPLTEENLEAGKAIDMLMSLCLLPAERAQAGLDVVCHYVRTHGIFQQFRPILMYMRNTWMRSVGPNTFSVFGQSHRTNNALEGFYSLLLRRMGSQP
ncbi:uncharacterized protein LOC124366233 [Homalodisca vitripennis]|uniref:uncharacterized protein LOC124366233 n=1 Tax=Homalodisca vitripennis TaxID=197043 RepID=UPI001EEA911D|nr:uncharacterized protein LOC124366233 [Homalodisca vitripennis]XP_046678582.1 uncharacterized protein LOC124366233 [Homalodisca vitripennis]